MVGAGNIVADGLGRMAAQENRAGVTDLLRQSLGSGDFQRKLDMLGGKSSYEFGGTFNDGKGQPGQANAVSHGCPPTRFKNANIINTGRTV